MDKTFDNIIEKLPYTSPFLFVDRLVHIDEDGVMGNYTFSGDLDFYKGHFKDNPITPGAILTECCAQIGVVCLGLFLLGDKTDDVKIALSSSEMEFYKAVYPEETVWVRSTKKYFRFNKLKCEVKMFNAKEELVCKGIIAGMLKSHTDA
ncbi:3-hydroxyacyl-ACP dehydratase FabZ family protein [Spongiimicrobium sp. 3-5]|uniref:3-hydroxyacyl-ACP dehydratase FabZ family protein n=1 Tax=Spongiimicrobium sp. 3-5 TaxID=3332596 RepID=UPI003980A2F7